MALRRKVAQSETTTQCFLKGNTVFYYQKNAKQTNSKVSVYVSLLLIKWFFICAQQRRLVAHLLPPSHLPDLPYAHLESTTWHAPYHAQPSPKREPP